MYPRAHSACPRCRRRAKVSAANVGRRIRCTRCGAAFVAGDPTGGAANPGRVNVWPFVTLALVLLAGAVGFVLMGK